MGSKSEADNMLFTVAVVVADVFVIVAAGLPPVIVPVSSAKPELLVVSETLELASALTASGFPSDSQKDGSFSSAFVSVSAFTFASASAIPTLATASADSSNLFKAINRRFLTPFVVTPVGAANDVSDDATNDASDVVTIGAANDALDSATNGDSDGSTDVASDGAAIDANSSEISFVDESNFKVVSAIAEAAGAFVFVVSTAFAENLFDAAAVKETAATSSEAIASAAASAFSSKV